MRGTLYRIFNIENNKSYIGKTYDCIYSRLQNHIKDSIKYTSRPLYRAFNKYGLYAFSLEILGEFEEGILEQKEIEYIKLYNSYGKTGYNATLGGDGTRYFNISSKVIINLYKELKSIKDVAYKLSCCEKTIRKILNDNNISIYNGSNIAIRINELDIEFESVTSCANFLAECEVTTNKYSRNKIYDVLNNRRKSYCGFTYSYI